MRTLALVLLVGCGVDQPPVDTTPSPCDDPRRTPGASPAACRASQADAGVVFDPSTAG